MATLIACIAMWASGYSQDWLIYDREHTNQWWRYGSASFSHYDLSHLMSNLLVFAALAAVLESSKSTVVLLALMFATMVATLFALHFLLPEYRTFAGISCVNYAILGYLLIDEARDHRMAALLAAALLMTYETAVVFGGLDILGDSAPRPVWQLHLIALTLGGAMYMRAPRTTANSDAV
jgi:membrane associated rhomboid family serine protease